MAANILACGWFAGEPAPTKASGYRPPYTDSAAQQDLQSNPLAHLCKLARRSRNACKVRRYDEIQQDYAGARQERRTPLLRGLRITVYDILAMLSDGMSEDEIIEDFPELEKADIRAALAFAADREQNVFAFSVEPRLPI